MGRGRAKAKQAKIARELKYFTPPTDLTALQQELAGVPQPDNDDTHSADHTHEPDNSPAR